MEGLKNKKSGIIVYTSFLLNKRKSLSLQELKECPKENFIKWDDIQTISTIDVDNWVKIETQFGSYYEDKSINKLIKLIEENSNLVFQKITSRTCICINKLKTKSNLSIVEMSSGQIFKVNRSYKSKLKDSIMKVWQD